MMPRGRLNFSTDVHTNWLVVPHYSPVNPSCSGHLDLTRSRCNHPPTYDGNENHSRKRLQKRQTDSKSRYAQQGGRPRNSRDGLIETTPERQMFERDRPLNSDYGLVEVILNDSCC